MQTYIRELLGGLAVGTSAELIAHVASDACGELPSRVTARPHRPAAGVRRAVQGLSLRDDAELWHGLDVDVPPARGRAVVVTVHDLSVFDVPWAFGRFRVAGERWLVRHALQRADAIIAVSAFTAERVRAISGRTATVTHLAPAPTMLPPDPDRVDDARRRYALPESFVLQVATVEPRKDVDLLAAACARAGVPLVLGGAVAPGRRVPGGVRHLGYVPAADLPSLYAAATIVAYISHYEGFGLPPIEAMACGAAVVATAVGALPDVVGDGAVLVAPGALDPLAAAITELVHDPAARDERRAHGIAATQSLSWAATAEATLRVYRSLGVGVP